MSYPGEKFSDEIEAARTGVATAMKSYSRGGSVDAVNSANRRLADAHDRASEYCGGNIPDDR